jgi:predicted lipoprotein with Yx(FWY)xxD motif
MLHRIRASHPALLRPLIAMTVVVAVAAMAAVALAAGSGGALTLGVAKNARVTNATGTTTHKNIVINSRGFAIYALGGDSKQHPECTRANGCFTFWPPVTIASGHKVTHAAAIKGTIGTWRRNGFVQLTLNGHPLYTFSGDGHKDAAKGEGINSFGGIWHVRTVAGGHSSTTNTVGSPTPASMTTTTATSPYPSGY